MGRAAAYTQAPQAATTSAQARMALTDYLKLRGRTWYVRVQIPHSLWAAAGGRREYVKTLRTGDFNTANRLKHAHIAAFQQRIKALEKYKPNPLADVHEKALAFRDALEKHKGERIHWVDGETGREFHAVGVSVFCNDGARTQTASYSMGLCPVVPTGSALGAFQRRSGDIRKSLALANSDKSFTLSETHS